MILFDTLERFLILLSGKALTKILLDDVISLEVTFVTIKEVKEKYKNYKVSGNERNMFATYDYNDGNGKVIIVVNNCKGYGKDVMQVVRVSDGKELFPDGACRSCDNLDDAIDVAGEMEWVE